VAVMRRMRNSVARLGTRYQLFFGSNPRSLGCNSDGDTRTPDFTNGRRRAATHSLPTLVPATYWFPIGSRRLPQVFVMKPTDAWHCHHPPLARRLHTPWLGCVLGQR
jgi:hypothetical protein